MIARFLKTEKGQLMAAASRRGLGPLLTQAVLVFKDSFVRKRHLVYALTAPLGPSAPDGAAPELVLLETRADLDAFLQTRRDGADTPVDWGEDTWFAQGWTCWGGRLDGAAACLGWVRSAAQSADFFTPLPDGAELLWHVTAFPEWRGQRLQSRFWRVLMQARIGEGATGFLTNCREYNTPSVRNIEGCGFRRIGYCDEARRGNNRVWTEETA